MLIFEATVGRIECVLEKRATSPQPFLQMERPTASEIILDVGKYSLMVAVLATKGRVTACTWCKRAALAGFATLLYLGAASDPATATSPRLWAALQWAAEGQQ
jgi:hypothetical protein